MDKLNKPNLDTYYTQLCIQELLYEFYKSYNKLYKTLEFDDIFKKFVLYIYMYEHGYLSVNKTFEFSREKVGVYDEFDNTGYIMITGVGVCRNISRLFCDILRSSGIRANDITVRFPSIEKYEIVPTESLDLTQELRKKCIEGSIKYTSDDALSKSFSEELSKYSEEEKKHIDYNVVYGVTSDIMQRILGNHEICVVNVNDSMLYMDPTNGCILARNKDEIAINDFKIKVMKFGTLFAMSKFVGDSEINDLPKIFASKKSLMSTTSQMGSIEKCREALKTCKESTDVFETFYTENLELYREINAYAQHMKIRKK